MKGSRGGRGQGKGVRGLLGVRVVGTQGSRW